MASYFWSLKTKLEDPLLIATEFFPEFPLGEGRNWVYIASYIRAI